jgi:hypothetical protein
MFLFLFKPHLKNKLFPQKTFLIALFKSKWKHLEETLQEKKIKLLNYNSFLKNYLKSPQKVSKPKLNYLLIILDSIKKCKCLHLKK